MTRNLTFTYLGEVYEADYEIDPGQRQTMTDPGYEAEIEIFNISYKGEIIEVDDDTDMQAAAMAQLISDYEEYYND